MKKCQGFPETLSKLFTKKLPNELYMNCKDFNGDDRLLYFITKCVPIEVFEGCSGHYQAIQEFIVEICKKIIEQNPHCLDHADSEGWTAFDNLLHQIWTDGFWQAPPELVAKIDMFWSLFAKMVTEKNVNGKKGFKVVPYSWILFWEQSVLLHDPLNKQHLLGKVKEIKSHFQQKGAREEEALLGLTYIQ